jgi:hypothetical protein
MREELHKRQVKEISVRQIILTVQEYFWAVLRGWPWLVLGAVLMGGYLAWSASQRPIYWVAETTFVVNDDQNSGGGGLGSVLGQIGLGGGGGGGGHNLKRIMAFTTSKYLLNQMLLDSAVVAEQNDLIINHVIRGCKLEEAYLLPESYGITKITSNSIDSMKKKERSLLKLVYTHLTLSDEYPVVTEIDDETGMLSITTKTQEEELSLFLSKGLYEYISAFYTLESTGQSKASVGRLQGKADSILTELNSVEYQLARFTDTRLSLANQRDRLKLAQLNRKLSILTLAYGEVVRNLEASKFALSANTPFFQLIDVPFTPLLKMKPNPLKAGLKGGAIGIIIASVFVALAYFYRLVMAEGTPETPN